MTRKTKSELEAELKEAQSRIRKLERVVKKIEKDESKKHWHNSQNGEKYSVLFEKSAVPTILLKLPEVIIIDVNEAAEALTGFSREEMVGKTSVQLGMIRQAEREGAISNFEKKGKLSGREIKLFRKDGKSRIVLTNTNPANLGQETYAITTMMDITELRQAEAEVQQSEKRFFTLFDRNPVPVGITSGKDYRILNVNDAWCKLTGYTHDEAFGHTSTELGLAKPEVLDQIRNMLQTQGAVHQYELPLCTRSGEVRQVLMTSEPVELEGQVFFFNNLQDVTEHKQVEATSLEHQKKLDQLMNILPVGISILNEANQVVFNNPALLGILQMTEAGLAHGDYRQRKYLTEDGHPMSPDGFASTQVHKSGQPVYNVETGIVLEDGQAVWTNVSAVPMDFRDWKTVIVTADITKRKQAEQKLRENEEFLRLAYEATNLGIWKNDLQTGSVEFNERARIHYGFDTLHTTLSEVTSRVHPEDVARLGSEIAAATGPTGNGKFSTEYRVIHPDGSIHWLAIGVRVTFDGEGEQRHSVMGYGTSLDITERRQMEEKLRESEAHYRGLFEHMAEGYAYCQMLYENGEAKDWIYLAVNESFEKLTGLKGVSGKRVTDIIPGIREADPNLFEVYSRVAITGQHEKFETFVQAMQMWFSVSVYSPKREFFVSVFDVITERKQLEEKLRESESRFRIALNNSPIVVFNQDQDLRYSWIYNPRLGFNREAIIGKTDAELLSTDDAARLTEIKRHVLRTGISAREEVKTTIDGQSFFNDLTVEPLRDSSGNIIGVTCVAMDITERKQFDQKLRESERNYKTLFDSNPNPMWVYDLETLAILTVNDAAIQHYGYSRKEFLGMTILDIRPAEDHRRLLENVATTSDGLKKTGNWRHVKKDGSVIDVEITSHTLEYFGRQARIVLVNDITMRKKTEAALLVSEQRLSNMLEYAMDAIVTADSKMNVVFYNSAAEQMFGIPKMEAIGNPIARFIPEKFHLSHQAYMAGLTMEGIRNLPSGKVFSITGKRSNGEEFPAESSISYLEIGEEKIYTAIIRDITERMKNQESLIQSEKRFTTIFESSPLVMGATRLKDGVFTDINHAFTKVLGFTRKEVLGHSSLELNLWWYATDRQQLLDQLANKGQVEGFRTAMRRKSGERLDVIASAALVNINNEPSLLIQIADISDLESAQAAMRESNERFEQIANNISDIFWISDPVTRKNVYVSPAFQRIIGLNSSEVEKLENGFLSVVLPEDQQILTNARNYETSGLKTEIQYRIRRPDGHIRWIRDHGSPIFDENGNVIRVVGIAQDITELKEGILAQQASEEKYRQLAQELEKRVQERTAEVQDLYENAPVGYHSINTSGSIIQINRTELNWLGYSHDELIEKPIAMILTKTSLAKFQENFPHFKETGALRNLELDFIRKNGDIFPALVNADAIYDDRGNYQRSRTIVFDNSERKKAENALRESYDQLTVANIKLEKALQVKDEFLASMSHELRTPLTGILGFSEALQLHTYGELSERQLKVLKNIYTSGEHLLTLINDVLDLSKIEAGKLEISLTPCNLADICQASLQLTKGMANQKHQHVNYSAPIEPILLNADARRIKQIIVNLLSNAIKFTPENGELGLVIETHEAEKKIKLTVWDKGIGIKPEHMSKLFQPFTQINSSLSREYSGTGLGLSLVQRLAELHNGTVEVESVFGKGSRFTVNLPWQPQKPSKPIQSSKEEKIQEETETETSNNAQLILITDDNLTLLDMLADYLETQNYRTAKINSGKELLAKIENIRPNLILMDIQMPGMDGLEAIRRLRKHPDTSIATTPIIAITALAMAGDRERCLDAGANDYLSKPVALMRLKEIIKTILDENPDSSHL